MSTTLAIGVFSLPLLFSFFSFFLFFFCLFVCFFFVYVFMVKSQNSDLQTEPSFTWPLYFCALAFGSRRREKDLDFVVSVFGQRHTTESQHAPPLSGVSEKESLRQAGTGSATPAAPFCHPAAPRVIPEES